MLRSWWIPRRERIIVPGFCEGRILRPAGAASLAPGGGVLPLREPFRRITASRLCLSTTILIREARITRRKIVRNSTESKKSWRTPSRLSRLNHRKAGTDTEHDSDHNGAAATLKLRWRSHWSKRSSCLRRRSGRPAETARADHSRRPPTSPGSRPCRTGDRAWRSIHSHRHQCANLSG